MSSLWPIVILAVYIVGVYLAFLLSGFASPHPRLEKDDFVFCFLWPVVVWMLTLDIVLTLAQNLARRTITALPALLRLLGVLSLPMRPYALGRALRRLVRKKKNPSGGGATETESPEGSASQ